VIEDESVVKYVEAREQWTNNLQFLDNLIIETLLFGDDGIYNCV